MLGDDFPGPVWFMRFDNFDPIASLHWDHLVDIALPFVPSSAELVLESVLLALIREGVISLDEPARKLVFPEFSEEKIEAFTSETTYLELLRSIWGIITSVGREHGLQYGPAAQAGNLKAGNAYDFLMEGRSSDESRPNAYIYLTSMDTGTTSSPHSSSPDPAPAEKHGQDAVSEDCDRPTSRDSKLRRHNEAWCNMVMPSMFAINKDDRYAVSPRCHEMPSSDSSS